MEGDERRQFILKLLAGSESPLSGTEIAGKCGVSRQIIVQDIALLRATNKNILSTYRGYLLYQPEKDTKLSNAPLRSHTRMSRSRTNSILLWTVAERC